MGGLIVFWILFVIALVIVGPLISILAVNTLFGLTIPFNLATWFASLWLSGIVGKGAVSVSKNS
jgi:hypothetical protein